MENKETKPTVIREHSRFTTFILMLCFLGIILVALFAVYLWFNARSLERHVWHLRNQAAQQQHLLDATQVTLQNLTQPEVKRMRALVEAEYLVKLANLNLEFERSTPLVINLLKTADQQLAVLGDPTLIHVRQALTNDISALEAAPKLDISGLILKINAISQQIPQLPVLPSKTKSIPANAAAAPIEPSAWKRSLNAVGHALSNVVVVRHLDQPIEPLLPPQEQVYLILNIQLQLSQAQWAVLHQQPEIYQQSLQQADSWIKQYFLQKETITQSVLQQLAELQNTNVKPVLPNISNSLNAIQAALSMPAKLPASPSVSQTP